MTKIYSPFDPHQIFNLSKISISSGINKDKLYNNSKGSSKKNNLNDDEKGIIYKIITDARNDYFKSLGIPADDSLNNELDPGTKTSVKSLLSEVEKELKI